MKNLHGTSITQWLHEVPSSSYQRFRIVWLHLASMAELTRMSSGGGDICIAGQLLGELYVLLGAGASLM
jgi:hypothetical protein